MLSIIIPVYNEADNISNVLSEIRDKVKTTTEIFIVYDFDEDNTMPIVNKWVQENTAKNIILIKNKGNGVLEAIKTGFRADNNPFILVIMADLSDDLAKVDEMVARANEGYDIVCGSRYMKGGKQIGGPAIKRALSRLAGLSLYFLTRIPTHDITNSFKLYSRKVLNSISIKSNGGFELGMEITVKAFLKGFKITEIPTTWTDRTAGKSRFKFFTWLPKYMKWYFLALTAMFRKFIV